MMLNRPSFSLSLFICFITTLSLSSTGISANEEGKMVVLIYIFRRSWICMHLFSWFSCACNIVGEFIHQDSKADRDRLKQLETIVFEQNGRLVFLEKQNRYRKDEHHILNTELSKHKNEIDQINDFLLKINIRNEQPFSPTSADISRLNKRPARLLPINVLRQVK